MIVRKSFVPIRMFHSFTYYCEAPMFTSIKIYLTIMHTLFSMVSYLTDGTAYITKFDGSFLISVTTIIK